MRDQRTHALLVHLEKALRPVRSDSLLGRRKILFRDDVIVDATTLWTSATNGSFFHQSTLTPAANRVGGKTQCTVKTTAKAASVNPVTCYMPGKHRLTGQSRPALRMVEVEVNAVFGSLPGISRPGSRFHLDHAADCWKYCSQRPPRAEESSTEAAASASSDAR